MKRKLLFTTCLMLLSMFMFGQTPKYVVGDLGDYSHNITITTAISFDDVVSDKELELGVYCNGEVRASVFTADYYGNGKYVAMLNVFGETGDVFTFKVYDHATQTEWENGYITTSVESTPQEYISFASDKVYGSLDAPCVIDFATPNHWNPDEYRYENTYTITAIVEIDGVEQFNPNFELGAFCNGEVRGSAKTDFTYTYNGNTRYYVLNMTIYGKDGDVVTFKLYDNEQQAERNFVDVVNPITLGADNIGTILEPLKINFLTTPYVAQVGEVKYQSFANAFNAALENNATITLLENFAIDSETYTVADGKNVTLDMAGKTITVTDNKTANYELFYIYGGMTVTGNGTIELTATTDRDWNASSSIFHNRGGVLNVVNGTFTHEGGTDMAYVIDNSGNWYGDATTNITAGELTSSYIAIRNRMEQNTHGASGETILNITGGTISGTSRAIWAQAASTSTEAPATGTINISGGTIGLIDTPRSTGAVSMTTVAGGTVAAFKGEAGELRVQGGTIGTVTIMTTEGVEVPYAITSEGLYVAAVAEVNGNYYATLQEAVKVGGTVKVLQNIVLTETVTINADKTVVLDLNGKTVTGTPTEAKAYAVITNKGNLTIMNGSIVCNHILAGSTGYAVNTITNCGTLTIDGATIKNESTADFQIGYAIDNNSTSTNAVLVVNSGVVEASGSNYYDGIRQFCNSEVRENSVTINDGEVSSLWMQNPSDGAEKNTKDVKGSFAIEGGKVGVVSTEPSANFTASITAGEIGKVEYFQVSEGRNLVNFITGGTFGMDVTEFCAPAYICEPNADGTYSVKGGLKGSGTEADPYLITNLTELVYFRNSVNAGETKYNALGVWVALDADIDMASTTWQRGIGDGINATFDGIFDGKNHTIKNLTMNPEPDTDGYVCGGLFGYTYGAATIQNLTLENVAITTQGSGHNVGALVGFANNNGGKLTVTNVTVKGDVKIDAPNVHGVGAIVGYSYRTMGTISNCIVDANADSYIKGYSFVGGITGYSYSNAIISGCTVKNIDITATSYSAGGVAGIVLDGNKVSGCTVESVTVSAQANYASVVGAIAANGIIVENCTAAEPMVGGNYSDNKAVQARIGNKYYATFAAALEAAQAGEEITLLTDIEASEVILIGKSVTINGNGHKVTSSASRVFRLTTSDTEVTLNGVNMVSTAVRVGTNDIRGISIDANLSDVEMTLNNCSVDFTDGSANDWTYAVNVSGNGTGHKVTVIDGTYEGANVINVHGANNTIVVEGAVLNCTYPNNDMYTGACFWVLQNQGSSVEATGNTFNGNNAIAFNLGTGTALTESNNTDNTKVAVAKIGDVYYTSVNEAINAAQDGQTVQLLKRTIDEVIAPWAGDSQHRLDKSITIVGYTDFGTTLTGGLFLGYNDGTVRENTITVKGINFEGKGVTVANQKNVVIEGNKFTGINALVSEKHGNSGSAILVIGSENNKSIVATVKNNVIENVTLASQAGIYMSQVANVTVEGNAITGTTHNAITISAATNATINVTNNTLAQWGLGGEGRAMRISGGATVNVNGNVMSNTAAPEEFVKITGATTIDASKNYWNGNTPLAEKMFLTDLTSDPVTILDSYYTDAEKQNLEELAQSVAKIGTKYYQSFASAIAAVKNGETIELLTDDCVENVTISQKSGLSFTINGNGKTYTGTITVNGNNGGAGLAGAGLTITNVNFVLNGEWQSGIFAKRGSYACNIIVDGCNFTGNDAKQAYGIRLRSGYNITVKNVTGTKLYDLVYAQENVIGFTAENVTVTYSNIGFWFPYGNNLNFKDVNLNVTGTGVGIINRNAGKATFENCVIEAKNAVTLSQNENNAIAYTLEFKGENEFTTSEEWLTVTGTNAVLKTVLNDAELDVTNTLGLVANIGKDYYNTLQHAINAAQDGDTVAIANDFTLDSKKYETQNDGYATLVNVKDKAVTIDLNGKTVTVETLAADLASAKSAMLLSVFHADTNGQLTLVDSSADGTGTVNVKVNDAKVYSVFASESQYTDKTNSGKLTVETGNYTTVGKLTNAMCFSDADDVITINGGNFHLDYASTIANYPWFVNTLGNNELQVIVNGGTFNVDINHQYRPFEIYIKKELALKNNGDGTWTIVPAEAYVTEMLGGTVNEGGIFAHNVGYATLKEAVEAVNNLGKTVTLLQDVEMASTLAITDKEFTLNGENYTISQAEDCNNTIALFDITRGKATLNKVTFDGIKGGAVVRTVNTEFAMNEVIAQNCEHTVDQGLFRLLGQNTITNSTFKNNECSLVMTINYDGANDKPQVVDNCLFEGNTVNGTAALYYVKGESFALTNSEFVNNTVNCNSNGATLYLGFTENNVVTGNLFKNNSVTDASTSTRVAGAIFFGYEANISGNAFDNNIAANANGDVLGQVCTSTYYDCEINLDGNYWNTIAPVYGRDYTVQHQTGEGTFVLDSYYTSYTYENDVLTLGDEATFAYVAEVGKFKYLTLAEAAAVAEGKTVTMLADIELAESIVFTGTTTLDLNGKTITGTDNNTSGNFYLINNNRGNLTIVDNSAEKTGKITLEATTERNWNSSSVVVANNLGTVTVKGGTIEHLGGTSMAYGIDNLTNGANTVATLNIEGGNVQSTYFAVRQFANGGTNNLNITDGIVGYAWMQSPNDNANVANISVEGGEVEGICLSGNNAVVDLKAKAECVGEVYGTMPTGMVLKEVAGYYTLLPAVAKVDETLYATLQDAVDAADGKTVVVLTDIDLTEGVTVAAGKVVTLDLAGYTISQTKEQTAGYQMILNDGTLTIEDSSDAKSGKISYTDSGNGGEYISDVIYNRATLVINGGTIENLSSATVATNGYPHAVDTYSGIRNTSVTINGGTIYCAEYSAVRMFCVSATYTADLTINDGTVRGAIDMQNGTKNAAQGSLTINGGNFETTKNANNIRFANWNGGATEYGIVASVTGGNFNGGITTQYVPAAANFNAKFIKGGTFVVNPSDYCAYGYTAEYNEDDELYYVKETYGTQTHSFQAGWNWFSSYVDLSQQSGLEKLQTALGESGIQIKGQSKNQSSVYQHLGNNIYDWIGDFALSTSKMYMVNTSAAVSAPISGDFVDYENEALLLKSGWNWISYPLNQEVDINTALQNLDATQGDVIKGYGQNDLAAYNGTKWVGRLTTLKPSQGYMYQSAKQTSFVYSTEGNTANASKSNVSAEETYWTPSMSEYANNMVVFATLRSGEMSDNYEVAAFANGECRGSARPIYIEQLDQYMLFMTIYGDEVEEMTFKCYDVNNGTEYDLINRMVYSNDAVVGSLDEPYIFTCSTTGIGEATLSDINIYPNPTTTDREINLQATCDKVEVFNTLGVKVAEYQNVDTIDALETAGTYVIRVTLNGDVKHCRLVVR